MTSSKSPVSNELETLIERFLEHADSYRDGRYNETQVRREFVDPLFRLLGWDVDNSQGFAEAYKDVIHEDAIKVGGSTKAPDYCFRIGGTRKFFVETKKPSINIKDAPNPAYQLRRYAWSAKLPLSILTDFEELAVYDCTVKPNKDDQSTVARVLYLQCTDFLDNWDHLASIFSREAVLKGAFDKYADSTKSKRGTAEVDDAFLSEIEQWREAIATNLAKRNPSLNEGELNFSVQLTIDRLIFLRICEDRGIESYGMLAAYKTGSDIYRKLIEEFQRADDRYNSGLFHFRLEKGRATAADTLTPSLTIDDKPLKQILSKLYYPESPYEFSVLPAEILGQVYERFLGKIISLTKKHQARIEEKPEVRKAGGVYYTPTYVVEFIVRQTVGRLIDGKGPQQVGALTSTWRRRTAKGVRPLVIIDPACGSGSFLLVAYQFLLDWYRDWYVADGPEDHAKGRTPRLYQHKSGSWRLTTNERKRILLSHIYGVDIDPQAVEVTKLSLLLKVLEGEDQETLGIQLRLFQERALPDLGNNIKTGNSLIASDFWEGTQKELGHEDHLRINAFDWYEEFPTIMGSGGFDAVIGNPPYIFTREQLSHDEREYYAKTYKASWEKQNTFMLFMEKMLELLHADGRGSFIVPNSWLTIESANKLRGLFIPYLDRVDDFNYGVFSRVSMEPCIFVIEGCIQSGSVAVRRVGTQKELETVKPWPVDRARWIKAGGRIVFSDRESQSLDDVVDKVVAGADALGDVFEVRTGLQAYEKGKGRPPQSAEDVVNRVFDRTYKEDSDTHPYVEGRDVCRYLLEWSGGWLKHGAWLSQPRTLEIFTRPRVLVREITGSVPYCLNAVFTDEAYLNNKSVLNVLEAQDDYNKLLVLLGVLNSKVTSLFYKNRAVKSARKVFPKIVIKNLREFPIPKDLTNKRTARLIQLVKEQIEIHEALVSTRDNHQRTILERRVERTNRKIDDDVCKLFGLTEEETKLANKAFE